MQPGMCVVVGFFRCLGFFWCLISGKLGFKLDTKYFSATFSKIFSCSGDFISSVINSLLRGKFKRFYIVTNRGKPVTSCKVLIGFSLMFKLSTSECLEMFC